MTLKFTEELCVKNNAKFEEELNFPFKMQNLTFPFKTDMRNLTNFDSSTAVKLGSFLQCSVHIFLGHDGCFKN